MADLCHTADISLLNRIPNSMVSMADHVVANMRMLATSMADDPITAEVLEHAIDVLKDRKELDSGLSDDEDYDILF